jgi:hypothetical protein
VHLRSSSIESMRIPIAISGSWSGRRAVFTYVASLPITAGSGMPARSRQRSIPTFGGGTVRGDSGDQELTAAPYWGRAASLNSEPNGNFDPDAQRFPVRHRLAATAICVQAFAIGSESTTSTLPQLRQSTVAVIDLTL